MLIKAAVESALIKKIVEHFDHLSRIKPVYIHLNIEILADIINKISKKDGKIAQHKKQRYTPYQAHSICFLVYHTILQMGCLIMPKGIPDKYCTPKSKRQSERACCLHCADSKPFWQIKSFSLEDCLTSLGILQPFNLLRFYSIRIY